MRDLRETPLGILLFVAFIIILDVVYFLYLGYLVLYVEGYSAVLLGFSFLSLVMWIDIFLTVGSLVIVPYGFFKALNWARLYALVFLTWSAFGAITYILSTGEIFVRYLLFVLYVLFVVYLLMSHTKRYFKRGYEEHKIFHYGEYTLYSTDVKLRGGRIQTIYFFSKKLPEKGRPTQKPQGYIVEVNKRTGLPYLKKQK
jgi:hypothetical protein